MQPPIIKHSCFLRRDISLTFRARGACTVCYRYYYYYCLFFVLYTTLVYYDDHAFPSDQFLSTSIWPAIWRRFVHLYSVYSAYKTNVGCSTFENIIVANESSYKERRSQDAPDRRDRRVGGGYMFIETANNIWLLLLIFIFNCNIP